MIRRHLWRWLAIAMLATFVTAAAAPATSTAMTARADIRYEHYDCNNGQLTLIGCSPIRLAGLRYVGWTKLNLNHCPRGMMCAAVYRDSMAAWTWTGTTWKAATLRQGWVYVYPYTGSWRWAWTQEGGWVAVTGGRFEIPYNL